MFNREQFIGNVDVLLFLVRCDLPQKENWMHQNRFPTTCPFFSFQQQNKLDPNKSSTKIINIPNTSLGKKIIIAIPTAIQNKIKPISRFMLAPKKQSIYYF